MAVDIQWVDASDLECHSSETDQMKYNTAWNTVKCCVGVIVPGIILYALKTTNHDLMATYTIGGFGVRGVEGKIAVATYCRENKIPYLGICLGMQVIAIHNYISLLLLRIYKCKYMYLHI